MGRRIQSVLVELGSQMNQVALSHIPWGRMHLNLTTFFYHYPDFKIGTSGLTVLDYATMPLYAESYDT